MSIEKVREQTKGGCIGHRGCVGMGVPQNTLAAFKKAISMESVKAVELDVRQSADGELVVFHDSILDELTSSRGPVRDMSYAQLQRVSYLEVEELSEDTQIPKLEQVLRLCWGENPQRKCVSVMIEVKAPDAFSTLRLVIQLLNTMDAMRSEFSVFDWCWISFFNPLVCYRARQLEPRILTCLLSLGSPVSFVCQHFQPDHDEPRPLLSLGLYLLRSLFFFVDFFWNFVLTSPLYWSFFGISLLAITQQLASQQLAFRCHRHNILLLCWTINSPQHVRFFSDWGIRVITDNAMFALQ